MSNSHHGTRLVLNHIRPCTKRTLPSCSNRTFSSSIASRAEVAQIQRAKSFDPSQLTPLNVATRNQEIQLKQHKGLTPIGSRRKRALAQLYPNSLPFEHLPYQCFQEARKVLAADREEKLQQISDMRARIARIQEVPAEAMGGDYVKKGRLVRMQKHLEELKILADINDPLVKKRFEDGEGTKVIVE